VTDRQTDRITIPTSRVTVLTRVKDNMLKILCFCFSVDTVYIITTIIYVLNNDI